MKKTTNNKEAEHEHSEEKCGNDCDNCCEKESSGSCTDGGSCGCCSAPEEVDLKSLGKEAVEMGDLFEDVNSNLLAALKTRSKILHLLHDYSKNPELKEKMDKVLRSRHPVLLQFVLGANQE